MPLPCLTRLPVPEMAPPMVRLPRAVFMMPVEELPSARFILIVWVLAELLIMSPFTVRAVPPLPPAELTFASRV